MPIEAIAPPSPAATLPRFYWLKRIAIGYVVLAATLAGVVALWAWRASVSARSLQNEWRSKGAPATVEEVNAMGPPFSERALADGAAFLAAAKAIESVDEKSAGRWQTERDRRLPLPVEQSAVIHARLDAMTSPVLAVVSLLDGRPLDFGVRIKSPMMSTLLPHLNPARSAADVLGNRVRLQHALGDDAGAMITTSALLELARQVRHAPAFLVQIQASHEIDESAFDAIESIAGTLAVKTPQERSAVERLIAVLSDRTDRFDTLRQSLLVERPSLRDSVENSPRSGEPLWTLLFIGYRYQCRFSADRWFAPALRACDAPDRNAADRVGWYEMPQSDEPRLARFAHLARAASQVLYPGVRSTVLTEFIALTRARAAAALLALRLYELDHDRLPSRLEELVPDYLPDLPRDATAAGAPALIYIHEADVVAIYLPDSTVATTRPTTMPRSLLPSDRKSRRRDEAVIYRGHEQIQRASRF